MNKYQKAIYRLFHVHFAQDIPEYAEDEECADWQLMKELVLKTIPMKQLSNDKLVCPICNSKFDYGQPYISYCCHCGQRLEL